MSERATRSGLPNYHEIKDKLICDLCGGERVVGDWPDCRKTGSHVPGNFGEEPLEAYVDKHVDTVPREITTRSERRAIMAKNHLEYVPKAKRLGAVRYFDMAKSR